MEQHNRRSFLRWVIHGLGALFAAVLGVPALAYLIDGRNRPSPPSDFRRVGRLKELPLNEPREVVIRETRRDAWTLHPNIVVGRVFLIYRGGPPDAPVVDAFTTVCPHLGCSINYTGNHQFLCPCHGGHWDFQGKRLHPDSNPATRGMDTLEVRRERVPGSPDDNPDYFIEVKYENFEKSIPQKIVQG